MNLTGYEREFKKSEQGTFGHLLYQKRRKRGFTQTEVANRIGLTRAHYTSYERNRNLHAIRLIVALNLSVTLDWDLMEILQAQLKTLKMQE
jgi:transcriptional regulator with XRE-family HTH domain